MRWLLGILLAILAVVTISVAALVYLVPDTAIERHILASAGRATNSKITTSGLPEITYFPVIDMTLRGVEIKPEGDPGTFAMKAREVKAQVSWLSILSQWTIDIGELKLVEPQLQLVKDRPERRAAVPSTPRRTLYKPLAVVVRQVGIEDGSIDGISDWRIKDINATVPASSPGSAMDVDVSFYLNAEKVTGNIKLQEVSALQSGSSIPLVANFAGASGKIDLDGTVSFAADPVFDGKVAVSTADIDAASRWLGLEVVPEYSGKPASLAGGVRYSADGIDFKEAVVVVADHHAKLDARVDTTGTTPIARDVAISGLDTNRLGLPKDVDLANLVARFDTLQAGAPVSAALSFDLNGEAVTGTANIPDLDLLTSADPAIAVPVKADFAVPGGKIAFDGKVSPATKNSDPEKQGEWSTEGRVSLKAQSARQMALWLGVELPQNEAFASATFEGDVTANTNSVSASNVSASLDASSITGGFTVDLASERPAVVAKLNLDKIDTARYVATTPVAAAIAVARRTGDAPQVPASPYELSLIPLKPSLEAHLSSAGPAAVAAAPGPEAHAPGDSAERRALNLGPVVGGVWSKASLGLEQLRDAGTDFDLDLTVGDLRHGDVVLGKSALGAKLQKGSLDIDVREVQPVEGRISGRVKIDTASETPAYDILLDVGGVPVEKVLQKAGQRDILRGKLTGKAELKASGRSEADIVNSLSGTVTSEFRDGAIVGYDIRRALRPFANREYDPRNTTPYQVISADFAVSDGRARSESISLDGPAIRIRGDGTANLKTAALNYRSRISLVPPPSNFSIPVKILGTWNQIKAALDWARLATQWTDVSPFEGVELGRRSAPRRSAPRQIDPELKSLIDELVAKKGGKATPPEAIELLGEMTGK